MHDPASELQATLSSVLMFLLHCVWQINIVILVIVTTIIVRASRRKEENACLFL